MFTLLFAAACQAGSAVAGLDPRDPVLNPIIVSIDLRTARSSYATDEAALIEAKGRLNTGQTVDAETEWVALDGGTVRSVGDGSEALFSSTSTGTFRVAGKGKGWGRGGSGGGTGGTSDTTIAPVDTVTIIVEPAPAPIASISVTPAIDTVYRGRTEQFLVSATRTDGSTASPAVTWRATGGTVDAGGYFTAPSTDGQYFVIATTDQLLADTARVTVTQAPNNEPDGFTPVFEFDFSALPGSGRDRYGQSSPVMRGGDSTMTLKSDATAPFSSSGTLQTWWPKGLDSGKEPGAFWFWDRVDGGTRYREMYVSMLAKIPTPDFENQAVYTKLLYFAHGNTYQTNDDVIALRGKGTNGLMSAMEIDFSHSQADDRTGEGSGIRRHQNVVTTPLFTAGKWHHVEVYANVGTVDRYDGVVKVWVDGVLVTNYTTLKFLDSRYSYTQGFFQGSWTPVWGGVGGEKTRDDFLLLDHLYISGKQ